MAQTNTVQEAIVVELTGNQPISNLLYLCLVGVRMCWTIKAFTLGHVTQAIVTVCYNCPCCCSHDKVLYVRYSGTHMNKVCSF